MTDEEKNSIELDIEAKYVGRKEKEFLNSITYAECLYILDTKNNYCDDIKNLSLLKIVDIIEKQSKEIEELKEDSCCMTNCVKRDKEKIFLEDKIKAKIEEVEQWGLYNMKIPRLSTLDERLGAKIGIKYVLQSLLEKEGE